MTEAEIEAGRTPNGGFTRKQLEAWGVPWPPPKGWKKRLIGYQPPKLHTTPTFPEGAVLDLTPELQAEIEATMIQLDMAAFIPWQESDAEWSDGAAYEKLRLL